MVKVGRRISQRRKDADPTTHIICKAEHDLRRAVPPRRDILGHEALLLCLVEPAGEPEIANLELAVCVHEQVARLEIAVQDVGRVNVFQAAERLVYERLEMRVREGLTRTDLKIHLITVISDKLVRVSRNDQRTMAWRSASMSSS